MKRNSINDCDCFQVRNFCHMQPLLLLAPSIEHPNFATAENCRLPLVCPSIYVTQRTAHKYGGVAAGNDK